MRWRRCRPGDPSDTSDRSDKSDLSDLSDEEAHIFLDLIKRNNRRVADEFAGSRRYFSQWTTNLALYREIEAVAPKRLRGRVLDAGAGRCAWHVLLKKCTEHIETLDHEPVDGKIDHVGDIQAMPLADNTYDGVFCTQVLHHVPEPQAALNEIARVLKPGGVALISAPHLSWLHNEPHDYQRFTEHGLRRMIGKAGLEEIEIRAAGGLVAFLGVIPSTVLLGLLRPVTPLFYLALPFNAAFVWLCLLLDRACGAKRLYPVNYVVVARKPGGAEGGQSGRGGQEAAA